MSNVTAAPAASGKAVDAADGGPIGEPAAGRPRGATWALAFAEARLLLRSRTIWVTVVLTIAALVALTWTRLPAWRTVVPDVTFVSQLLGITFIIVGHLAASRTHRYGRLDTEGALPTAARHRTVALLAAVPVAVLVSALVLGIHLLGLMVPHPPVGPLDLWGLLGAVAIPAGGAALGVAVGRWRPGVAAGPLAVLGAVAFSIGPAWLPYDSGARWLTPGLYQTSSLGGPPAPTGWHLGYLCALAAVACAVALLRHRRTLPLVALGVATAVAAGSVVMQARTDGYTAGPRTSVDYAGPLRCQRIDSVDYCVYRGYAGWIPVWREAVEPVTAALPAAVRTRVRTVQQVTDTIFGDQVRPDLVFAPTTWGRHSGWAADSRADLAAGFAAATVGLPSDTLMVTLSANRPVFSCWGGGQARTVVALWLTAQAMPDGEQRLRTEPDLLHPVRYGPAEVAAALALLALPRERVTAVLGVEWDRLTAAGAGAAIFQPLGLPATDLSSSTDPEGNPCP